MTHGRYHKINAPTTITFLIFHIDVVAALFNFTWTAFWTAVVLNWVALSLGIGMAYHRLLTHRSYKVSKFLEYFLTVCATLALEGGPSKLYLSFTGSLILGSMLFGLVLRRRKSRAPIMSEGRD